MPEFKRFPKTRVAYVTEVGPFQEAIPRGFQKLFAWLGAQNLQPLGPSLGIFHDDPAKVPVEKLRSELCVPVAPKVQGSGEVQVKELAEFEAATIVYQGDANITPAYNKCTIGCTPKVIAMLVRRWKYTSACPAKNCAPKSTCRLSRQSSPRRKNASRKSPRKRRRRSRRKSARRSEVSRQVDR